MTTLTPLEARCVHCHDTGSLSKRMDGDRDCIYCDATEKRIALRKHLESMHYGFPDADSKAWAAYLFAQRQAAPVAAQLADPDDMEANYDHSTHDKRMEVLKGLRAELEAQPVEVAGQVSQWRTFGEVPWFDGYPPHPSPTYEARTLYAAPQPAAQPSDDVARDASRFQFVRDNFNLHFTASDALFDRASLGPNATIADAIDAAMAQEKA